MKSVMITGLLCFTFMASLAMSKNIPIAIAATFGGASLAMQAGGKA